MIAVIFIIVAVASAWMSRRIAAQHHAKPYWWSVLATFLPLFAGAFAMSMNRSGRPTTLAQGEDLMGYAFFGAVAGGAIAAAITYFGTKPAPK